MKYREQWENYWPTPEELRACKQVKSSKPPSKSWGKKIGNALAFIAFMAGVAFVLVSASAFLMLMEASLVSLVLFTVFLAPICFLLAIDLVLDPQR
jgi:hypothetical protein